MESGRNPLLESGLIKQVAGQLLYRKLIEWQVAVNRVNDPLAINPRVRSQGVSQVAFAVGIPREVQPVASPAFAEMCRAQQLIDELFVGVCYGVSYKGLNGRWRWRESGDVQIQTPNQRATIRRPRRFQPCFTVPMSNKGVDRVSYRKGVRPHIARWNCGSNDRLQRP